MLGKKDPILFWYLLITLRVLRFASAEIAYRLDLPT